MIRFGLLMTKYIALLRAVNVGGTGKLPMSDLKTMCCDAGFAHVETYIASGNVVFESEAPPSRVRAELEDRLHAYTGKRVGVVVRSAPEMLAVLKAIRFPRLTRDTRTQFSCMSPRHLMRSLMFLDSKMRKFVLVKERFSFTTLGAWAAQS